MSIHASAADKPVEATDDDPAPSGAATVNSARVIVRADVTSTMFIKVTKANNKPGTVSVYAQLTGDDGAAQTESVDVIFTGASASLTLGEAQTWPAAARLSSASTRPTAAATTPPWAP